MNNNDWEMNDNNEQTDVNEPQQEQPAAEPQSPYMTFEDINAEPDAPKKKKHTGLKIASLAVVCALVGSIGGGTLVGKIMTDRLNGNQTSQTAAPKTTTPVASSSGADSAIVVTSNTSGVTMTPADIFSSYSDAVVGINCESTTNVFGQSSTTASSGSGFIITADGYVVTNHHVIENADTVNVLLKDETSYPAEVVGYDADNDVALLKIQAADLPTVAIGDSSTIQVGEQVVAIGNPLGELTHTLTAGYISALDREINTDGNPKNMLQTDAAINAGNSGGPLFDSHGNVIGITTAKLASSSIEGLGFAIPIDDAMNIVYSIQQYGYVKGKPSFGITVASLSLTYASYYGLPVGCYVNAVNEGSAAEKAGMMPGDIITKIGDVEVQSLTELSAEQKNYKAGDTVEVTVYRQSDSVTLTVTFDEELPDYMQEDEAEEETQQQQQQGTESYGFNPYSFFFGNGGSSSGSGADSGTAA